MTPEQCERAEEFIGKLGLMFGQFEKKEHANGYRLYVTTSSKLQPRFGYVRLNVSGSDAGKIVVYANGDFSDSESRFTAQPKNPKDVWYRFWPDDKAAKGLRGESCEISIREQVLKQSRASGE